MTIHKQFIALYTLTRRELVRMFRIASQVFLPPVITTGLYFMIFGTLIGKRIGLIDGVSYAQFIAPGLILMSVITNAYSNVSTSLFSVRFQRSIEELLVSPMHPMLILLGYIFGGILRGTIVALLVFFVSAFFVHISLSHFWLTLSVIMLVSTLFSLAGFANGMLARSFDDVMLVPTFILTPLTYLGGVFYSIDMLSPFWRSILHANPIYYMITALRHAMLGQSDTNFLYAMALTGLITLALFIMNWVMLVRGIGLRE